VPDITASPAVDVAIGLFFLFVLLSLICSTINEMIAGVLSWRARFLEEGIRSMLAGGADLSSVDGLVKQLAAHPLVQGRVATPSEGEPKGLRGRLSRLRQKVAKPRVFPSYLNNRTFALTFLDTIAPPELGSDRDVLARAGLTSRASTRTAQYAACSRRTWTRRTGTWTASVRAWRAGTT
jgi:hypothetical protein